MLQFFCRSRTSWSYNHRKSTEIWKERETRIYNLVSFAVYYQNGRKAASLFPLLFNNLHSHSLHAMAAAALLRHICKPQTYASLRIISKTSSYASLPTSTDIKRFSHLFQGKLIPVKIFQFFFLSNRYFLLLNVILFSGLWNMHFLSIEFTLGRNGEWFIDQNHWKHDLVTIKACTFHRRHPINP